MQEASVPEAKDYCQSQYPLLIVISGPSGVGKDSVIRRLREKEPALAFVVTAASREPRPGEVHGVDYYFFPPDEFQRRIDAGEFLENAVVYGELKGILKKEVRKWMDTGRDVVLRVDVQGAATIRQKAPEALMIFLTPETDEELVARLTSRNTETPERLKVRIETARQEMARVSEFDYKVVNREGCMEEAVDVILAIIAAEHHAIKHRKVEI